MTNYQKTCIKEKAITFTQYFVGIFLVLAIICAIGSCALKFIPKDATVIETTTEIAEVTNTDYSVYHIKNVGTRAKYIVAVRTENISEVIEVSSDVYAQFAVGDEVEIEIIKYSNNEIEIKLAE